MVRLRAHTLLCLQGFRGLGYSQAFVQNLSHIHQTLMHNPETIVEVVDAPDTVCAACPHQQSSGCTLNGEQSEEGMREQDRHVMTLLGIESGGRKRWREILERIRLSVRGSDLPDICGQCRWLPLGYCREGIDRLRAASASGIDSPEKDTSGGETRRLDR